jgi:hypothetical protein
MRSAAGQDAPDRGAGRPAERPQDPVAAATAVRAVPAERPEQQLTDHDRSDVFDFKKPAPITPALKGQDKQGRITGFDFARDPLNADQPFTTFEEVMSKESAERPAVMARQRQLLESRYINLVQELNLTQQEKADLVAFLRVL